MFSDPERRPDKRYEQGGVIIALSRKIARCPRWAGRCFNQAAGVPRSCSVMRALADQWKASIGEEERRIDEALQLPEWTK